MNPIDELELLSNVFAARREAKALLAETTVAGHSARLRRIVVILGYMREHLEMLTVFHGRDERITEERAAMGRSVQSVRFADRPSSVDGLSKTKASRQP